MKTLLIELTKDEARCLKNVLKGKTKNYDLVRRIWNQITNFLAQGDI